MLTINLLGTPVLTRLRRPRLVGVSARGRTVTVAARRAGVRLSKRDRHLLEKYGLRPGEFEALLDRQGHACAICRRPESEMKAFQGRRSMHVDHDHETGAVRGLLCVDCNHAIGRLGDNAEGVRRALDYLEGRHPWAG